MVLAPFFISPPVIDVVFGVFFVCIVGEFCGGWIFRFRLWGGAGVWRS